jgi:hypothetical protein
VTAQTREAIMDECRQRLRELREAHHAAVYAAIDALEDFLANAKLRTHASVEVVRAERDRKLAELEAK